MVSRSQALAVGLIASTMVFGASMAYSAHEVGHLSKVEANHDMMPPGERLKVTGMITAPAPCFTATVSKSDKVGLPETLYLQVELVESSDGCARVLTDIEFSYSEDPYAGGHNEVTVASESDEVTVKIGTTK